MNYEEAVAYIHSCARFGSKKNGLDNITELLKRLGDPQEAYRKVHIAGTNGKGSTAAALASICMASGLKTGLYTSPYLERFNERFRVDGVPIADETLAEIATDVISVVRGMVSDGYDHPTEFEVGTAVCFEYFRRAGVDIAVIETGLGGRLDSTNVIIPEVSVITAIGLDHVNVLGDTIEQIAAEKAGIIKPGVPCVLAKNTAAAREVIRNTCNERGSRFYDLNLAAVRVFRSDLNGTGFSLYGEFEFHDIVTTLLGEHQIYNMSAAAYAAKIIGIENRYIYRGILEAKWPGRLEIVREKPMVILDGAHNEQGAAALAGFMREYLPHRSVTLVTGILAKKDTASIAAEFSTFARRAYCTEPPGGNAMPALDLARLMSRCGTEETHAVPDAAAALEEALSSSDENEIIVIAGSLYLAGALRGMLVGKNG